MISIEGKVTQVFDHITVSIYVSVGDKKQEFKRMTWWNKDNDISTLKMFGYGLEDLGKLIVYTADTGSLITIEEFEKGSSLTQPNKLKKE